MDCLHMHDSISAYIHHLIFTCLLEGYGGLKRFLLPQICLLLQEDGRVLSLTKQPPGCEGCSGCESCDFHVAFLLINKMKISNFSATSSVQWVKEVYMLSLKTRTDLCHSCQKLVKHDNYTIVEFSLHRSLCCRKSSCDTRNRRHFSIQCQGISQFPE